MTLLGRNQPTTDDQRFYTLADMDGNLAVYDSHTGLYAPFYGATATMVSADLNQGIEQPAKYKWEDHL